MGAVNGILDRQTQFPIGGVVFFQILEEKGSWLWLLACQIVMGEGRQWNEGGFYSLLFQVDNGIWYEFFVQVKKIDCAEDYESKLYKSGLN